MKKISVDRWLVSAATALTTLSVMHTASAGTPSQTPLLGRQPVAPNLVFTLDDSGSMLSPMMPEAYTSATPLTNVGMQVLTPQETVRVPATINPGAFSNNNNTYNYRNTLVPTRTDTGTLIAFTRDDAMRRSAAFNRIYYNPAQRYKPWVQINADGSVSEMAYPSKMNVTVNNVTTADWVVPLDPIPATLAGHTITKVNLSRTGAQAFTHGGMNDSNQFVAVTIPDVAAAGNINNYNANNFDGWCAVPVVLNNGNYVESTTTRPGTEGNRCRTFRQGDASAARTTWMNTLRDTYDPAVYYTNANGTPVRVSLNSGATSYTIANGAARTDCTVNATTKVATCTKDQEFRNFATWFMYYRTRLLLAKAAVGRAFASPAITDFRFGYGALNNPIISDAAVTSANVDGVNTQTLVQGVRNYPTIKSSFYSWLYAKRAYSGTPLRRATDNVGIYYSRKDNKSPWVDDPANGTYANTDVSAGFAGCRRSYHILTTDGYWSAEAANANDPIQFSAQTSAARNNVDGTDGPKITYENAKGETVQTYQYKFGDAVNKRFRDDRSNMLGDVAMYYWYRDLLPSTPNNGGVKEANARDPSFWQNVVMYTVGLGTSGTIDPTVANNTTSTPTWPTAALGANSSLGNAAKSDDLIHAAVNARGLALSAADAETFESSINAILDDIAGQSQATAGVGVSSSSVSTGFAKYEPAYLPGIWTGEISKFELDLSTGERKDADNDTSNGVTPIWTASSRIPAHASRNIHVWVNGTSKAVPFTFANLTADMKTEIATTLTASDAMINYLRGDTSNEGSGNTSYRKRASRLGDIVNSPPVYVKDTLDFAYSTLPFEAAGTYNTFLKQLKSREAMIFVGANDGMLHAFLDKTDGNGVLEGTEVFAYVPRAVLPTIGKLTGRTTNQTTPPSYTHQYFVDGPVSETHAHIGGQWRSLLLGSMGAGAKGLFAIDVTSTTALKNSTTAGQAVKWEINASTTNDIGHIFNEVEVGPIQTGKDTAGNATYTWVALVGNGQASASNRAKLLVVDVSTGSILATLDTGVGTATTPNGLGGVRAARDPYGVIKAAYAGDELGNLWRFDLNSGDKTKWTVAYNTKPLFSATDTDTTAKPQPITATPAVMLHPKGGSMVVVGTGKMTEDADRLDAPVVVKAGVTGKLSQVQSLYGIWDVKPRSIAVTATPSLTKANLVQQTINTTVINEGNGDYYAISNNPVDWKTKRGWYMNLVLGKGQRVIYPLQAVRNYVFVNSVVPSTGGVCDDSSSFNAVINALNGTVDNKQLFDVNGDGKINSSDKVVSWYPSESDGRERIVNGAPRQGNEDDGDGSGGACGKGQLQIIRAEGNSKRCIKLEDQLGVRTWRIINNPPRPN